MAFRGKGAVIVLELVGQDIVDVRLVGAPREYDGVRLLRSTLSNCYIVQEDGHGPGLDVKVRNVLVERCRLDRCIAQGVLFEDVTVDTLRTAQVHRLYGCVFKHVTLRGNIGPIMAMGPQGRPPGRDDRIAGIVAKYKEVDWALDIRDAVFSDADFYYVPGELIRRDENTQVLLRRERFVDIDWRGLPGGIGFWVRRFESTPFDSIVGIAPKRARKFRDYMADIEWLHKEGLAE
jgi:hypothetical protein